MDDNTTRKFPPRPQPRPADDSEVTQKLPLLKQNRLITEQAPEYPPLEYEEALPLPSSPPPSMATSWPSFTPPQKVRKQWPTWKRLLATFLLLLLLLGGGALAFGYYYF